MTNNSKPLKVLHIVSGDRWAGAEVQAYTLLCQLKNKVALNVILMNEGELAEKLREDNIETTVLNESSNGSLSIFFSLRQHIKDFQPDVIHTHRQKENILGSFANVLSHRAKCIRTIHGAPEFSPTGLKKAFYWLDELTAQHLQNGIISVSQDLSNKLAKTYPAEKIHTVTNGIDIEKTRSNISEVEFKQQQPDHIHVGLVGRLDPVKRVDIFLDMAAKILAAGNEEAKAKQWHFHVFGEGNLLESLQTQTQQLNITDAVTFHGHRLDIQSCIAALNIMVMPSDHEGLPMAALEAMALNTPLIAHNVGGLTEVLADYPELLVSNHQGEGYMKAVLTVSKKNLELKLIDIYNASSNGNTIYNIYRQYYLKK